jgi:hypothetical protein
MQKLKVWPERRRVHVQEVSLGGNAVEKRQRQRVCELKPNNRSTTTTKEGKGMPETKVEKD